MSLAATEDDVHEDWEEETYLFSSAPSTPREKTPDILVRFQAVSSDRPCVEARSVFISSQCTLIEVRRLVQRHFQCLYERGFIFLRSGNEVTRAQERAAKLLDVLPRLPLGMPSQGFLFPGVQYKKLSVEKDGRRSVSLFVGVVYICEASSEPTWSKQALRTELSGNPAFTSCFAFIPYSITSANQDVFDFNVDELNLHASLGNKQKLLQVLSLLPSDVTAKRVKDQRQATPLHYASHNGHVNICEALIGRFGYDILYMKDCNLRTPLHCALHARRIDVVCYLLHLAPDLEWHDVQGFSCARMLHDLPPRHLNVLLTRLEPEVLDPQLVLLLAVFALTKRDVKQALRFCRFTPPVKAPFYRPPLHLAAELGNVEITEMLLSNEVVRNSSYRRRVSSANSACSAETGYAPCTSDYTHTPRDYQETYRLTSNSPEKETGFLSARTDSGISSGSAKVKKQGRSKVKAKPRDLDIVSELDVLLEEVWDTRHSPMTRDGDGHLPFHYACQHGHHELLGLLYFANMTQTDFLKGVKLALNWHRFEVLNTLSTLRVEYTLDGDTLSSVVKESERDIYMVGHALLPILRPHMQQLTRLLPHAAWLGAGDVVRMLLDMNVPANTADFLGRTPLHEAAQKGHNHVVGVLLHEAGVDPNARDWRGSTPLHYASEAGHVEVIETLLSCERTEADCTDIMGRTPLLRAAHSNQHQVMAELVKRHLPRLSPMHTDVEGRSVLHYLHNVPTDITRALIEGIKQMKEKPTTPRTPTTPRAPKPFFVPPPRDLLQETELSEIWEDPSIPSNRVDERGRVSNKVKTSRRPVMITMTCKRCGKSFSCSRRTKNWYHVCTAQSTIGGPPSLSSSTTGRTLIRLPTFMPAGTQPSAHDPSEVTRRVQRLPIPRPDTPTQCQLTPLDVAIINNQNDVMLQLVQAFPDMAKRESTAFLAARMANWEALRALHKTNVFTKDFLTRLVHVTCIQRPADTVTQSQFIKCLRLLFKLGGSPNYIPDPKNFKTEHLSPSEESLVPFMALEVAAILGSLDLADLLLESGASASICFAVHLAALKGNVGMLAKLLPHWKEGRWRPYIKGFDADANELVRVCTLESGLVQAACASEQVSMQLLKLVAEEEKDILASKKILTHHMVFAIRPHVCSLTAPTLMNKFLYKHVDDVIGEEHVCQHLVLSNLLRCPEHHVRHREIESMAVYLIQKGAYLREMRVSRKSTVHVACEVFVLALARRMWRLLDALLEVAGKDIWGCLLAPHHTCHKYVYSDWSRGHSGFLCLSKGMLHVFRILPLNLLRVFLDKGKAAMKATNLEDLKAALLPSEHVVTETMPSRPLMSPSPAQSHCGASLPPARAKSPVPEQPSTPVPRSPVPVSESPVPMPRSPVPGSRSPVPAPRSSVPGTRSPAPVPHPRFTPSPTFPGSPALRSTPMPFSPRDAHSVRAVHNGGEMEAHVQILTEVLAYHVHQTSGSKGELMVLSKLTLLCPPLMSRTLSALRFHLDKHTWLPHAPQESVAHALKKNRTTSRAIKSLVSDLMEVSLWVKMSSLPLQQLMAVQEQGLSLLHLACIMGDNRLAKACLSVVICPLAPDVRSWSGLTPLEVAASQGSTRLMDILVKGGACATRPILVAACVGRQYTELYPEGSEQNKLPDEKAKLLAVQWCARSLKDKVDLAYTHPKHGTVFDVTIKKRHWTILDWLLTNTEASNSCKLLARCKDFAELAHAPDPVLVKLLKTAGEVLLVIPDDIMHSFMLQLSTRADCAAERVLRRMTSLNYFSTHHRLVGLVTARGKHNETVLHNICRAGHVSTLKLLLFLFSQNITANTEISDFLDAVDGSGCTPLWYCLAHKRWTMAEYLVTSGVRVFPRRAVPDFCVKRGYPLCKAYSLKQGDESPRSSERRRSSVVLPNNSARVAEVVSPASDMLITLYKNLPPLATEEAAKAMAGASLNDSGISASEAGDGSLSETEEDKKRNLRYLLSLMHYAGLKGATLVHAAAAVGDKDLLEGLMKSPYCSAQLAFSRTFSPLVYAIANGHIDTITACLHHGLGPHDDDPVAFALARAILAKCGIHDSDTSLKRLLAHQKVCPELEEAVQTMLSTRSSWSPKIRSITSQINGPHSTCTEMDLVKIIREVIILRKGQVSEVLLLAAGVTGKLWVFKALLDSVESKARLADLCTRLIVPKAAFIDLLFLFAPRRMTQEKYAPEYFDRMKILRCISSEVRLTLQPQTLRAAIQKNLLPMLEMVIKDHTRNRLPLQPSSLWFESIFKASTLGDVHYVNIICAANLNVKVNVLQNALLRALCLACLHRNKQIANRLLLFKLPLLTPVTNLPGEFYMQPQLVMEAAIEGGDSVVASLILQTMEETGTFPASEDILRAIFMAFRKGMEPIIDNLLMFAHYVAPELMSLRMCHSLFLIAARSGHGRICSKFLNLQKLNVNSTDSHGYTALHYACMYGRGSLVRAIISVSPNAVQAATPEGLTALDLARCMGNWELAYELISDHGAMRGAGIGDPEIHGWMNRLLMLNVQYEEEYLDAISSNTPSRELSLHNLIKRGDDRATRCMLEVAQESIVSCMIEDYASHPMFHLCAQYGCMTALQILLRLIEAQPQLDVKLFMEYEINGMIPLALAIRAGHVACVEMLIQVHYPTKWRMRATEESILHVAARAGHEEIVQLVAERATNTFLQAQDADGLIPATTAVAYGNHHVVKPLLRGLRFAEKLHHAHLQTTYWCILCLLDMCLGWSKAFQEGRVLQLNRKGRNIFQRHRTEAGFTVCSHVGARAVMGRVLDSPEGRDCLKTWKIPVMGKGRRVPQTSRDLCNIYVSGLGSRHQMTHVLDNIEWWTRAGASPEVMEYALGCMQYANRGHRPQLFLLLSQMTRYEAMSHVIRKGQPQLATYLYTKIRPGLEPYEKREHFLNACAQGLTELASAMIAAETELDLLTVPEVKPPKVSALDLSVAFGHQQTTEALLQGGGAEEAAKGVIELRALSPFLSVNMKWQLGVLRVGGPAWRSSMDYRDNRLSHVDLYLVKHPDESSFPGTLLPRDVMPVTVCGKQLDLEHLSMKNCVAELTVNDTWLTAHVLSRAVLGRYQTEIDSASEDWDRIEKITLHIHSSTSYEEAKVIIQGHTLHDIVKVEKQTTAKGGTRFHVTAGPMPLSLTSAAHARQRVISDVIPQFKRRLAVTHGVAMDVTVDWNSIDMVSDVNTRRTLIHLLAGDRGSAALSGLTSVMEYCMYLVRDMALLVNRRSAMEVVKQFSQTKLMVVKYVKDLPLARGGLEVPLESRVIWYFSLDADGNLKYNTSLFPIYTLVHVAHSLFSCLAPALRRFPSPPENTWRSAFASEEPRVTDEAENVEESVHQQPSFVDTAASETGGTLADTDLSTELFWDMETPEEKPRQNRRVAETNRPPSQKLSDIHSDAGVVLDFAWDNFAFLTEVRYLLNFIRKAMAPELYRVADSYAALSPLDLGIGTVAIRTAFQQDGSGLQLDDHTLTVTLHCFSHLDNHWGVGPIDSDSFFFEKRTSHLCSRWRAGTLQMSASLDRTTRDLTRALGFPVSLPVAGQTLMELLCRVEGRQMTHPHKLLKLFLKALSKNVTEGYVKAVTTALSYSGHCWLVGRADVPSNSWCWIRMGDVARRKAGERFLVLARSTSGSYRFRTMKSGDLLNALPETVAGVWHKRDHGVEGSTGIVMRDAVTDRVQLVTIDGHVFLTTHARSTCKFMTSLPLAVELGMPVATGSPVTMSLWLDDVFLKPLDLGERTEPLAYTNSSSATMVECWQMAASLGFHLVFDLFETPHETPGLRDAKSHMCSMLILETLRDITDKRLCGEEGVEVVVKMLASLGTVTVSPKLAERAHHIVRGGTYGEEVNVYLVAERDLQIAPLPSVWDRHDSLGWPKPFTESLRAALCASFVLQTRSSLSSLLNKKLSRIIHEQDISFIEVAERSDRLRILASAHAAVNGFFSAFTHFVERYLSGMRKLKSDLTSIIFTEEVTAGPVVSLHAGILKVALFKNSRPVERRMFVRDLLVAVAVDEEVDEEDMALTARESPRVQLRQRPRTVDTCTVDGPSSRRRPPRVHKITKHHSDNKYIVERAVQRLLAGVESGKTGDIIDSIDIGANVNCVNENAETPLLLAAKGRNYVIQELLLSRGADVNMSDQAGMTALHYESGHGDSEAVKLLLAHGADSNAVDVMGRTPLHYAVVNNHVETTDALVFCGADASISNKDGRTPRALCQHRALKLMMRRSDITVKGLATGHIYVEHLILEADTTYSPDGVGLSLRTPQTLGQVKTRLMLRRVIPEYSTCGLLPVGKEQLLSDVYEFRMSGARVEGPMILRIPVHARPGSYDDVCVKTDKNVYSAPLRAVKQDGDQWVCLVRINLNDVHALIVVTKPRVEQFSVPSSGGDYTSLLDHRLGIRVLQGSFTSTQELALEVMEQPTFEEEEFDAIMSMSHFYSLHSVGPKPQKPLNNVIVSIPLPDNFFGEGDLFVLLRKGKNPAKGQHESWDVISRNPDVSEGMVKFRTPELGMYCLIEKARRLPESSGAADSSAIRYVTRLHQKAQQGDHDVIVFAMARATSSGAGNGKRGEAELVVEVVLSHRLHSRLEYWKGRGYVDHKPCFSNNFIAQPMQEFLVQPAPGFELRAKPPSPKGRKRKVSYKRAGGCCHDSDPHLPVLYFHPKRDNCMCFTVCQRHLPGTTDSWVDVFTVPAEPARAQSQISKTDSAIESEKGSKMQHVTKLHLRLPWPRTEEHEEEERLIKFASLSPFAEDQNTGILESVATGLGSDWVKVAILLGVAPPAVAELEADCKLNDSACATQMLSQWRSTRSPRQDRGVSELLIALKKAGRQDLVTIALDRLRSWLTEHGITGGPMAALLEEKSLTTPRSEARADNQDEPEPMSGLFLRSLARELGPRFDLAPDLGLSKPEMDTIMADPLLPTEEDKVFKMLLLSRDKQEKQETGLSLLLNVTRDRQLKEIRNWILETAKRWMIMQGASDDHFSHAVGEILYNTTC